MNGSERAEFVGQFKWPSNSNMMKVDKSKYSHGVIYFSEMSTEILREDFARFVSTVFKYGKPIRLGRLIKMGLQVDGRWYWVNEIQDPTKVEAIYRQTEAT